MSKPVLAVLGVIVVVVLALPLVATRLGDGDTSQEVTAAVPDDGVPRIMAMDPPNGAAGVDPNRRAITVTFSTAMGGGFSWTGGGPTFPGGGGKPYWQADQKTCVLPVTLQPNHSYRLGINSPSHRNFKSLSGISVQPTRWTFTTGGG